MTSKEILGADMLDILFDNRNKKYGAYELRRHYNARLLLSMTIAFALAMILFLLFNNTKSSVGAVFKPKDDVKIIEVVMPRVELPPVVPQPAVAVVPPSAEASYNQITMVADPSDEHAMAAISDIEKSAIGGSNVEGPENISFTSVVSPDLMVSGRTEEQETASGFMAVEEQPEFPGGTAAWRNFLNRYLQVPASLNAGELKIVKINFKVDVDGTVTGFNILQSAGREFDNEVIRVLKKMPKWKPAMQNGRPVAIPFTQPVTFVGVEQ